ncbi:sodium channel protein type 3 subunit alpha-like [Porites lutea]|uniref:sodium channel protein type 3 subunit alpha-like n=1 Tax=Porites lutea TaxID=51062 RepID=UPI003CC5A41C
MAESETTDSKKVEDETNTAEKVQGKKRVRINEDPLLHIVDDSKSSRAARVPSFYIGKPLIDFDGGIASRPSIDTFLVVSRRGNSSADHVFRFNKANSLCLFGPLNPIKRFAIRLVTNKYFESFVILTILINCVFLVLENPPDEAE